MLLSLSGSERAFAHDSNKAVNLRIKEVHTKIEQQQSWIDSQIVPNHQGSLYLDSPIAQPLELHNPVISTITPTKAGEQSAHFDTNHRNPSFKAADPESEFLEDSAREQENERRSAQIQRIRATEFERRLKEAGVKVDRGTSDQLRALGYMN